MTDHERARIARSVHINRAGVFVDGRTFPWLCVRKVTVDDSRSADRIVWLGLIVDGPVVVDADAPEHTSTDRPNSGGCPWCRNEVIAGEHDPHLPGA
ncbi:hypothetical protein G9U51_08415 [Calidifontibacter sp. DB0510]|uniref:Uncharacterized protein n=1 Tax=Metallococcus carri TaxID=1656884 RepID=A0A967AZ72_9MICO|nr:hypothetical protein [Metallococcus carri]NHN55799.1 hypothetical protein [Metallococcus carri]NOP38512.1 hypothetical protein [Calidifontibacter sp. DB2511S]